MLETGAAQWIISTILFILGGNASQFILTLALMVIAVGFTQIMSNIALSAVLIPISVSLADATGVAAVLYAVAIACSLSFMLPISDPTVAMANSEGKVHVNEIIKIGSIIALIGLIVTAIMVFTIKICTVIK